MESFIFTIFIVGKDRKYCILNDIFIFGFEVQSSMNVRSFIFMKMDFLNPKNDNSHFTKKFHDLIPSFLNLLHGSFVT
ncbi:hypothetical protein AD937_06645 [Gluconobacter japonicus]|nr:hypothetical protein AD937_06645 [Gluconobacter japonicus]